MLGEYQYLILSGGGTNGILQLGALQFIEHCLKPASLQAHFKGFAGTSIGALLAFSLACGLTTSEILAGIVPALPSLLS